MQPKKTLHVNAFDQKDDASSNEKRIPRNIK